MTHDYIEINKNLIPYEFQILLVDEMFKIGVNYNTTAALFVVDLYKLNEETGLYNEVCLGEPVIYGKPLWQDVRRVGSFPNLKIIPLDESGSTIAVTFDNLGKTTFLTLDYTGE